MLINTGGIL